LSLGYKLWKDPYRHLRIIRSEGYLRGVQVVNMSPSLGTRHEYKEKGLPRDIFDIRLFEMRFERWKGKSVENQYKVPFGCCRLFQRSLYLKTPKQIIIDIDQGLLQAYGIDLFNLNQALRNNNVNVAGGYIMDGGKKYSLRSVGL
jgi:hypothetical protein